MMVKKLLTFIMLIFIVVGLGIGLYFSFHANGKSSSEVSKIDIVLKNVQTKQVQVKEFFTYGRAFNFSGILSGISKDNFESVKLYLTNGDGVEKTYPLSGTFQEGNLVMTTTDQINDSCILDDLEVGEYVVLVRLKLNNSVNPKYYSLENVSASIFSSPRVDTDILLSSKRSRALAGI